MTSGDNSKYTSAFIRWLSCLSWLLLEMPIRTYSLIPLRPCGEVRGTSSLDAIAAVDVECLPLERHDKQRMRSIVSNYKESPFDPWPLLNNPHLQTIIGSEAIRIFTKFPREFVPVGERLTTPDGDFVDMQITNDLADPEQPMVVLLHGLESDSNSPLITKMANCYIEKGFMCVFIVFRSCGSPPVMHNRPGGYHLGFTDDVDYITTLLHQRYPQKPIYLSGFSLGGNVVLKFLGELGDDAWDRNIRGSVVTCVPFDPVASQKKLDQGFNRAVYSENFLRTLKNKAEQQIEKFPGSFDIEAVRRCRTIGDFDEAFIAPIYGFKDRVDYYRKTGSRWWLKNIRVPTIAINALDDPFIEETALPTADDIGDDAPVRVIFYPHGGHCGFIFNRHDTRFLRKGPPNGFLSGEMARAMANIFKESGYSRSTLRKDEQCI